MDKGPISDHPSFRVECEDYTNMKWFMHPLLVLIPAVASRYPVRSSRE